MSRFYRLSINEVDAFEVIVVHPDTFLQRYATDTDFVNSTLDRAAHDALCQQWKAINRTEDPPPLPERFKIEPISGFDPSSVHPCLGPFHYITPIGTVSYITKGPSWLGF